MPLEEGLEVIVGQIKLVLLTVSSASSKIVDALKANPGRDKTRMGKLELYMVPSI